MFLPSNQSPSPLIEMKKEGTLPSKKTWILENSMSKKPTHFEVGNERNTKVGLKWSLVEKKWCFGGMGAILNGPH